MVYTNGWPLVRDQLVTIHDGHWWLVMVVNGHWLILTVNSTENKLLLDTLMDGSWLSKKGSMIFIVTVASSLLVMLKAVNGSKKFDRSGGFGWCFTQSVTDYDSLLPTKVLDTAVFMVSVNLGSAPILTVKLSSRLCSCRLIGVGSEPTDNQATTAYHVWPFKTRCS